MKRISERFSLPKPLLGLIVAGALSSAAGQAPLPPDACADPRACIETLHQGLVTLSDSAAQGDLEDRYARLEPLISTTHDLAYIARVAVRRHWSGFSVEEQEAFVQAFARLSVMTYASRFVTLSDDTFRILEVNESGTDRAQVIASISREPQPDIPMEYLLQERAGSWQIVNVIADGVSDLALRRSEYQRILADGSADDLLAELERQIEALRASASGR